MLNKELELSLNYVAAQAQQYHHEYLTLEHLLLALLHNREASEVLKGLGADIDAMERELWQFIQENTPIKNTEEDDKFDGVSIQPTMAFQRVLQRAIFHMQSSEKEEVSGANVLVAIFSEKESFVAYLLQKNNIERLSVMQYLSHDMYKAHEGEETTGEQSDHKGNADAHAQLDQFALNLNKLAAEGHIDPLIGREKEVERVIQTLCRRRKNNPLLVGEAGVGKTAIAEGLAYLIEQGKVPDFLKDYKVYTLDIGALLAGTKYRGDFEKRFKNIIDHILKNPHIILFIDEIHTIIGAGATSGGQVDVANLIKPLLASGRIRVMGSTTYQEYSTILSKDRALSRRFQKIDIAEPSLKDTVDILLGLKKTYEAFHQVKYTIPAIKAAVELSTKYINDRFLPDKAIDVIDEAGAYNHLLADTKRKKVINVREVEAIIAKIARIPDKTVTQNDKSALSQLDTTLKAMVFGQDSAIDVVTNAIKVNRAGLGLENHPIGAFLFAGPTGVGKTEVAVQLAKTLGVELLRFDMSEYMESHTVSRLIGAPPGYVGYTEGGLLTDAVIKHPHCVLLLDEIEKAHPDIFNLLLQVMDNGILTDNNGRKADFRHVILIMTSNAGVRETEKQTIGFTQQQISHQSMDEIKRLFTPEFRNRLDNIVWFNQLDTTIILKVVEKFITHLQIQLATKDVDLSVTSAALTWLAEQGYDKAMGARPMQRTIQRYVKQPLADELLFGKLAHGGKVVVDYHVPDEELDITFA